MISVNAAYSLHRPFVKGFKTLVQFFLVLEIVSYRLVHQLIAENHGLITIAAGNLLPDIAEQQLTLFAFEQPGITEAVVNVIARLTTRTIMHVENQVKSCLPAPFHHLVNPPKSFAAVIGQPHIVLIGKEFVVEWQANCIRTCRGNETDVGLSDVVLLELLPECRSLIGTDGLTKHQVYHPRGVSLTQSEHIPFRIEPVAQIGTLNEQFPAIRLHQIHTVHMDKLRILCLTAYTACQPAHNVQQEKQFSHISCVIIKR